MSDVIEIPGDRVIGSYAKPTGALRWIAPSPGALAAQPTCKRLQQEWLITEMLSLRSEKYHKEWRDVPLEFEFEQPLTDKA